MTFGRLVRVTPVPVTASAGRAMDHRSGEPAGGRSYFMGAMSSAPARGLSLRHRLVTDSERRLRWISLGVLVGFLVVVVLITLTPGPPDPDGQRELIAWLARAHRAGLPRWITYELVESGANVVMFVPLGLFGALALPAGRRWLAVPALVLLTVGIELTQAAGLPGRYASVADVLANALGAVLGYLVALLVRRLLHRPGRTAGPAVTPRASTAQSVSVVIPARALQELARILADADEPVELVLAQARNQVLFHLDGVDLVSRLIDGQFPNYQQVLPASHASRAEFDREELLRAVRPAALIASSSANIVKLQVGGDGTGLTVTATAEVGDYTGDVEGTVEGDATTIAFNARYLADVLSNVGADRFSLELNGPLSPGVFRPVGDADYVHVVMPVRTTS